MKVRSLGVYDTCLGLFSQNLRYRRAVISAMLDPKGRRFVLTQVLYMWARECDHVVGMAYLVNQQAVLQMLLFFIK